MKKYLIFTSITDGIREKSNNILIRLLLVLVIIYYAAALINGLVFLISPQPTFNLQIIRVFAVIGLVVFFLYVMFFSKNQKIKLDNKILEAEKGAFKNNFDPELNNKDVDISIIKPSDFGSIEVAEDITSKMIISKIPEVILIICGILLSV